MLTKSQKNKVVEALKNWIDVKGLSYAQAAVILGINTAQLSQVLRGKYERILKDENFIRIANRLDVPLDGDIWRPAKTQVFAYLWKRFELTQRDSTGEIFVDRADLGKSYTAKQYAREVPGAIYIDCSQYKTRTKLIKAIARELGINAHNRKSPLRTYSDFYNKIVDYLNSSRQKHLIILDEAGDLTYSAFLELKALWNATEGNVGWYMMGASGLRKKLESYMSRDRLGYEEIFSRFGGKIYSLYPIDEGEQEVFRQTMFYAVCTANGIKDRQVIKELYAESNGSLRRLRKVVKRYLGELRAESGELKTEN